MLSGEQQRSPHASFATATEAHLCFSGTTGASSMLHGALHQSVPEQLEAIRVIRGAASPLDDDKCQEKKGVPPPATLKFPFAVLRCLVRGRGKGKGDLWHRGES